MEVILTCDLAMPTTRGGRPPGKAQVCREAGLRLHDLSFARSVVQGLAPTVAAQRYLPDSLVDERVASAHLRHVLQIAVDILGGIAEQTAANALLAFTGITNHKRNQQLATHRLLRNLFPASPVWTSSPRR